MFSFFITYVSRFTHKVVSFTQYQSINLAVLTKDFSSVKVIKLIPSSRTNYLKTGFSRSFSSNWPKSLRKTSNAMFIYFSSNPDVNISSIK